MLRPNCKRLGILRWPRRHRPNSQRSVLTASKRYFSLHEPSTPHHLRCFNWPGGRATWLCITFAVLSHASPLCSNALLAPHSLTMVTPREQRKPSPLNQTVAPNNANSIFRNALDPAAVLHDAASSATNLLAAVNDMLKSPVLASFHRRSILDKPLPGRPRSYTAPPTPTIAELPGSILLENQGFPRILELSTSFDDLNMRRARGERAEGLAPDRPFTSPREMPARRPTHKKSLSENASKGNRQARSTMNSPTWSKDSNLSLCSQSTNPMSSSFDSVKAKVDSESTRSLLQPSPLIIERKHTNRSSLQTLLSISDNEVCRSAEVEEHLVDEADNCALQNEKPMSEQIMDLRGTITAQNHTISTLTSQFASLRSAHEAHVASLVDAHAKELATLKTYTEGLEQRTASFKAIRRGETLTVGHFILS